MHNYNTDNRNNVPTRHKSPDDLVELVQDDQPAQQNRPASFRRAIPGINCVGEGDSIQDIIDFRARWNLPPVTR